ELTPRPPTPTPEPPTFIYTVDPGDTLVSIGRQYGVDVATIIRLNNITDPNSLKVGQQLRIPGAGSGTASTAGGGIHVVQAGETLFSIASHYGVTVDRLAAANSITDPDSLLVGQELRIPQGTSAVGSSGVRIHVVQAGETLSAIATRYGVSPEAIMQANGISDANAILAGSQLTIP
ncbi:MAG: LysM peptidoglycan-binding domain-containing protein, partial [Chloroflexi bacterium]|nr:LysM peptidoglycan-binding domain-containing protein [Chloroflexota bacterium]